MLGQNAALNPEWAVNFGHFPIEFMNPEEALEKYNNMGLALKIQFR